MNKTKDEMKKNHLQEFQGFLPVLPVACSPHPTLRTPSGVYSLFREDTGGEEATKERWKAHGLCVPGSPGWAGAQGGSGTESDRIAPPHPPEETWKAGHRKLALS